MKTRDAILLTIALFILGSLVRFNIAGKAVPLICFIIPGAALWAAIDSANLQLRNYRSPISCGPVVLFCGLLLFWVIAFPWYLAVRRQIQTGTAPLKNGVSGVHGLRQRVARNRLIALAVFLSLILIGALLVYLHHH